jgi:hypothetical protein
MSAWVRADKGSWELRLPNTTTGGGETARSGDTQFESSGIALISMGIPGVMRSCSVY